LRLRYRLWRARSAGSLSQPADAEEAVPAGRPQADAAKRVGRRQELTLRPARDAHQSIEQLRQPRHERLVGHVKPQRRHRDSIVGKGRDGAAVLGRLRAHAYVSDPVIGVAAAVLALVDLKPLLPIAALARHRNAL